MSPKRKKWRIYQSLSSAFSRKSSPKANSPEPSAAVLLEATELDANASLNPEGEGGVPDIGDQFFRPLEDNNRQIKSGHDAGQEPEISDEPVPVQLQSKLDGLLRAADSHLGALKGTFMHLPTVDKVVLALEDIKKILKPPWLTGRGYKDPELDLLFRSHLEGMQQFMWTYINPNSGVMGHWQASSLKTANDLQRGPAHAWKLCNWVQMYVADREDLPANPYGQWNESVIDKDPALTQEINAHLQGIGK
jgi:hypothetical protein